MAIKKLDFTVIMAGWAYKWTKSLYENQIITESENTYLWNVVQSNGQSQVETNTKTLCKKKKKKSMNKLEILAA